MSSEYIDECQQWLESRFEKATRHTHLFTFRVGDFWAIIRPQVSHFEVRTKFSRKWLSCDDAVQLRERVEHDLEQQIRSELEGVTRSAG